MDPNLQFQGNPVLGSATAVTNFSISGYPTVSVQITGTLSSGSYTPQASNDGTTWVDLKIASAIYVLAASITAVGLYRADTNGYQMFRLNPSSPTGSHQIWLFASSEPMTYQGA